jgi:hypothetical protein
VKSVESGAKQHAEMALKRFPHSSTFLVKNLDAFCPRVCVPSHKLELAKAGINWWIVKRGSAQAGNRAGKIARHNICGESGATESGMRSFSFTRTGFPYAALQGFQSPHCFEKASA